MSERITFVPAADVFKGVVFALAGDTGSYFSPLPKHTFANSMLLTPSGFVWWCQLCEVFGSPFKWRSFILGKFGVAGWWVGGGFGWVAVVLFIYLFVVFFVASKCFLSADLEASPVHISPSQARSLQEDKSSPVPQWLTTNCPPTQMTNENTFHTSASSCSSLSRPF